MTYAVHNIHTPPVLIEYDENGNKGWRYNSYRRLQPLGSPLATFETLDEALAYQADKRALMPVYTHGVRA